MRTHLFHPADPERPRILIIRLSAIGDCIHTAPLLAALRRRWPGAHLTWITQPGPATLLAGHRHLDDLWEVPRGWLKSPRLFWQLRNRLRRGGWDAVLDVQSLTKSSLLGWLSGVKCRVGFGQPQGRELSLWLNNVLVTPTKRHVVDRYLEILTPLGVAAEGAEDEFASGAMGAKTDVGAGRWPVEFELGPYPAAVSFAQAILQEFQLRNQEFVMVNAGAGWGSKLWPARRYAAVAKYLGQRYRLPSLVVWSGGSEQAAATEIAENAGGHAFLAPDTTLPQLAELARRARCFIGSDTGPLHLAAAMGTPCVALYGPTDPSVCGPYGVGHVCVQTYLQDQAGRRHAENDAMRAIEVPQVCDACDQVLDRTWSHSQRAA